MKLSKLYSNKSDFKQIHFNEGMNVIIGEIKNPENDKLNCHNLGKSTLVKIIDFMLLKKLPANSFLKDPKFQDYVFYLEVSINDGRYVTIRRAPLDTKISFKIHNEGNQDFTKSTDWDYPDYSIYGKKKNALYTLQDLLAFDVLNDVKYRNTLTYFLRNQEDYGNPFQLSKYFKNKDRDWKPFLFELLGYDGQLLSSIYTLQEDIENKESEIASIKKQYTVNPEDADKLNSLKYAIETQIDDLTASSDNFDFYLSDKNISKEIVKEIETQVAKLNVERYQLESKIESIKKAIDATINYDYDAVYALYQEMGVYFSSQLKCSLNELIDFNNKISEERRRMLQDVLVKKQSSLDSIDDELIQLNSRRVALLGTLKQEATFGKFKDVQKKIAELSLRGRDTDEKLEAIRSIRKLEEENLKNRNDLNMLVNKLNKLISDGTALSKQIKDSFTKYVRDIIGCLGMLNIRVNSNGNVEFEYNTYDETGKQTYEKDGHTYLKEICACVDLAILSAYSNKSFYKFVFHDGCVDGDDYRIANAYLNLARELSQKCGLQIILTIIESVSSDMADKLNINSNEIVLRLNDNADGSGKLFGFTF